MELTNAKIRSEIGKQWILFLIMGILSVMAGIYFAMNFGAGFEYIALMVSIYFLVSGIIKLYIIIQNRSLPAWPMHLILAIISFIMGIIIITDYFSSWLISISGYMIFIFCGAGYISEAISLISNAIVFKKEFGGSWILILILGILLLFMAFTIVGNPLLLMAIINIKVAVSALTFGISSIFIALQLKKLK